MTTKKNKLCRYCEVSHPILEFKKSKDVCYHGEWQLELERKGFGHIWTSDPLPMEDEQDLDTNEDY